MYLTVNKSRSDHHFFSEGTSHTRSETYITIHCFAGEVGSGVLIFVIGFRQSQLCPYEASSKFYYLCTHCTFLYFIYYAMITSFKSLFTCILLKTLLLFVCLVNKTFIQLIHTCIMIWSKLRKFFITNA